MKAYDGSLMLSVKDNWLLLKNTKGAMTGRRGLKTSGSLSLGAKLSFPNHVIRLGLSLLPRVTISGTVLESMVVDASSSLPPHVDKGKTIQADTEKGRTCMDPAECTTSQGSVGLEGTNSLVHASIIRS
jgi:hypothetical protein